MRTGARATACSANSTGAPANPYASWRSCWRNPRVDTKTIPYRIVEHLTSDRAGERARVVDALMATPASISPKYFYDELGCALYGAICRLPEYYPTRTEASIFSEHRLEIATA